LCLIYIALAELLTFQQKEKKKQKKKKLHQHKIISTLISKTKFKYTMTEH